LPYKDNELSRSPGRLFLLSIPDLIRDPEGREFIQRLGKLCESKINAKQPGDGSFSDSGTSPNQKSTIINHDR
jgi:hypothetical protein